MSLLSLTDEELMVQVQAGNAQAFELLFQRHGKGLFGYLRRRSGDEQRASELFQDTWLKVHRFSDSYQAGQPFKPWLFGIAVNTFRDSGRKQQRQVDTVAIEPDRPLGRSVPAAEHAQRLTLEKAIDALPDTLKDAFLLGVVHGMDHREIAAQLDISPANARARISRARAFLRDYLRDGGAA
ncbi:MAG: RNA polymerase sigma factor [Myxococcota bacterium]|nr:RNA polymerase sigma factor [Myxococcota bacterium]